MSLPFSFQKNKIELIPTFGYIHNENKTKTHRFFSVCFLLHFCSRLFEQ